VLRCYLVWPLSFYQSGLGGPNKSIKTPASIALRVIEVCNPPTTERWQHMGGIWNRIYQLFWKSCHCYSSRTVTHIYMELDIFFNTAHLLFRSVLFLLWPPFWNDPLEVVFLLLQIPSVISTQDFTENFVFIVVPN